MVNTLSINKILHPLCKLIGYYSSWDKLKSAVALTLKVKETLIQLKDQRKELWNTLSNTEKDLVKLKTLVEQHMKQYKEKMRKEAPTLKHLNAAENKIIGHSQHQWFREVQVLQGSHQVWRNSQLYKLDPVLQQGILRVGGRLS